jgi:hypothetical protein
MTVQRRLKKMRKKLNAEEITMMCIRFCEQNGLLNSHMGLSTIEYLRHRRDEAVKTLRELIRDYGTADDKRSLRALKPRL